MTQEEIDAIAERNVRPVLDDMTRKAEAERARVSAEKARAAEGRMELEEKKRLQAVWRMQEKEVQEELKNAKAMGKEEEKHRKEEEKRHQKERRQSLKTGSKLAKDNNSNSQSLPLPAPIVPNSNNFDSHTPKTPTSPKAEKGLRGLINKFRARKHSRNASRTSPKEFFPIGRTVATNNNTTSNYSTAPSRYSNIPPPPSAPQTSGTQTPTTIPTLAEVALLGAPPSAPTASTPAQGSPPRSSSPVSSLHSFKCRGETVPEVYISDDDGDDGRGAACNDHNNNDPRGRGMEDTGNHSDSAEERDTFPGPPAAAMSLSRSGEHLPLDREASAGEPGNRSSVGSRFFENL